MTRPTLLYRIFARGAFTIFDVQQFRLHVAGLEHVPASGGVVVAVNHTSFWDFLAAGRPVYDAHGRPPRILAKESLFRVPAFGTVMRSAGHIPVVRGAGGDAYRIAIERLHEGELILVLPEQTHSPTFDLLPFKTGAVRMAIEAGVPVVPCVVWGIHRFHTTGRAPRWSWRLPVSVHYGSALWFEPETDPVEATQQLRQSMQALLDTAVGDYPDGAPADGWWVPARLGGSAPNGPEPPAS